MFLRKLLAGFAVTSLLVLLCVCVLWMRSYHHTDQFGLPGFGGRRADVTSHNGMLMVVSTQKAQLMVLQRAKLYPDKQVAYFCLLLPAMWLALFIRAKLLPFRPKRLPPVSQAFERSKR